MRSIERWLWCVTVVALGIWALDRSEVRADGSDDAEFGVLTAQTIRLVDAQGTVTAVLATDEDGTASLRFEGDTETPALKLGAGPTGGEIEARNTDGKVVLRAGVTELGHGSVTVMHGTTDAVLAMSHDAGGSYYGFRDAAGGARGLLGMDPDGVMSLYLGHAGEGKGIQMSWDEDGSFLQLPGIDSQGSVWIGHNKAGGIAMLYNKEGQQVSFWGTATDNHAGLLLLNAEDGTTATALGKDDDGGYVSLKNPKGDPRVFLGLNTGGGMLNLRTLEGQEVAWIGADSEGHDGLLQMYTSDGKKYAEMSTGSAGGMILLKNRDGNDVAYLGTASDDNAGMLLLHRRDGSRFAEMSMGDSGALLSMRNASDNVCAWLGASSGDQAGYLFLGRQDGSKFAELAQGERGGYLDLKAGADSIAYLGADRSTGAGLLKIMKADGKTAGQLAVDNGGGHFTLWNHQGESTLGLFATDASWRGAGMTLSRTSGTEAVTIGVRPDNTGGIDLRDASGNVLNVQSR